jgi:hypothetical protein
MQNVTVNIRMLFEQYFLKIPVWLFLLRDFDRFPRKIRRG